MSRLFGATRLPGLQAMSNAGLIAFSCGVILLYRLTLWPACIWLFPLGAMATGVWWYRVRHFGRRIIPAFLCCLLIGLFWATWHSAGRLDQRVSESLQGVVLTVSGHVCSLPQPGSFDSLRFNFCVQQWHEVPPGASGWPGARPEKLRLAWYGRKGELLPDHRLRLQAVLKRPHGNLNSAGFRYEDWLFRHGIRATGSIRSVAAEPALPCGVTCRYHTWYQRVAETVHRQFSDADSYPLIASLLIGNRSYLDDDHWQTLKATGTIHLVAISGLHLGLLAVAAGALGRKVLLLVPVTRIREQQIRVLVFLLVVACCFLYALLAGFGVPTRRALIMVIVGGWYLLLAQEASPWRPYLIALALVLVTDPFAPLDQGFWLSFGAVAVLLVAFAGRVGSPGWLKGLVIAQLAIFAGLWPILAELGQQQPLAGLIANTVAIPWLSLVVMPVLFGGVLLIVLFDGAIAELVTSAFNQVLGALMFWLQHVQSLSLPSSPELPWLAIVLLAACVILVLRFPEPRFRAVAVFVVMVWAGLMFFARPEPVNSKVSTPEVVIWDVGQGLSVLVRAENRALVYDTGPGIEGVFSAAESVLIPGLKSRGVHRIDKLVISHGDSDHAGGLSRLLADLDVGDLLSGEVEAVAGKVGGEQSVPVRSCPEGSYDWAGLRLGFWRSPTAVSGNAASCVLRVYHPGSGSDLWLTGDITREVERQMLAGKVHQGLPVNNGRRIVVAPHHGSKTSSSAPWVGAMAPDHVIYTAGYQHRYGHPHPDVTRRYRQAGARALNTACSGEITIVFTEGGPEIRESRYSTPFWINRAGLARDQCLIP